VAAAAVVVAVVVVAVVGYLHHFGWKMNSDLL